MPGHRHKNGPGHRHENGPGHRHENGPGHRHDGGLASPDMARFLNRLPAPLAASFAPEQLAAVELHFAMRNRPCHAIDWRRRIRLPFLRAYVVLLAGTDRAAP